MSAGGYYNDEAEAKAFLKKKKVTKAAESDAYKSGKDKRMDRIQQAKERLQRRP